MTARVASEFAEALRGERDPMQLLFPGGSIANAESLYRDSPTAKFYNGLVAEVVSAAHRDAVRTAVRCAFSKSALARAERRHTSHHVCRVTAWITRSPTSAPTFVARARTRFASYPFMRFETLDLEREPEGQGFEGAPFRRRHRVECDPRDE